jgi:ribosomal-protein-alanine N-acetyltransferase
MPVIRVEPMREGDVATAAAIDGTLAFSEAELRAELARPGSRLWVARFLADEHAAENADTPRAFLSVWHVADELHVLNLVTHPDSRRRGLARALMNDLLTYAGTHGVRRLLLEVRRSNRPALALYRSLSFAAVGLRVRYYRDDEDAVEMALALDAHGAVVAASDEVTLDG